MKTFDDLRQGVASWRDSLADGWARLRRSAGAEGRWRMVQCAYGSFQRTFALPAPVKADDAKATYRNGVLRIELRKLHPQAPAQPRTIPVH